MLGGYTILELEIVPGLHVAVHVVLRLFLYGRRRISHHSYPANNDWQDANAFVLADR